MRLFLIGIFIVVFSHCIKAQEEYMPGALLPAIDSLFVQAHEAWTKKDKAGIDDFLLKTDQLLAGQQNRYPLFTGLIQLHQVYYATEPAVQKQYLENALQLLKNADHTLPDVFASQLYWLISAFSDDKRMKEWARVDSVVRYAVLDSKDPRQFHYAITNYADKKLNQQEYALAKTLANYEKIFFENIPNKSVYDKTTLVFNKWLLLKADLQQWFDIPFANRNSSDYNYKGRITPRYFTDKPEYKVLINIDYKKEFTTIFKELNDLSKEMVINNSRGQANYNQGYRSSYYNLYTSIINKFYEWAIKDYRHSEALLPLKKYLLQDVMANEVKDAQQFKKPAVVSADHIANMFSQLSALYYAVGNGAEASQIIRRGQSYFLKESDFNIDEKFRAIAWLAPHTIRASRLEGDMEAALRASELMKKYTPAPDSINEKTKVDFEWFAEARYEEVYTLLALNKREDAIDSLSQLLDAVVKLPATSEELVYTTRAWTNLQFLTATIQLQKGVWNKDLINEMVNDLLNNKTELEIFYPSQLLDLKATLHQSNYVSDMDMNNLLIYTRRQLQSNFILLTAEERMRLYEQRLNPYFDVYHELLFSGRLDSLPSIKEEVIAQSLYLKNAMADGNVLSDEIFVNGNHGISKRLLDELRKLRQQAKMSFQTAALRNFNIDGYQENNDNVQSLWLQILDGPGRDSLVRFPDWKKMSSQLKAGEVYIESIRYTRWLTDSAAVYAAYVLLPGKPLQLVNICTEDSLVKLLNDPGASPQTASLDAQNKRGTGLLNGGAPKKKIYKTGDPDKLAELVLTPIWPYIKGHNKLLLVQDGLFNRISFAALLWQQKYLLQHVQLRQLSASYMLSAVPMPRPVNTAALLSGGLDYGQTTDSINMNRLLKAGLSWQYLPGTKLETEALQTMFAKAGYKNTVLTGTAFPDTLRKSLEQYSMVHLATHGFYFDTVQAKQLYADRLNKVAIRNEPLYRCGLAVSNANDPFPHPQLETQGYLLGYELANTDLRNCYLVALSACETGLGDVRNNLGVDGLSRALKIGGARHLLISLWKVPDAPTAVFMKQFYSFLFAGNTPAAALHATQAAMSKTYPASDWGAFILVE